MHEDDCSPFFLSRLLAPTFAALENRLRYCSLHRSQRVGVQRTPTEQPTVDSPEISEDFTHKICECSQSVFTNSELCLVIKLENVTAVIIFIPRRTQQKILKPMDFITNGIFMVKCNINYILMCFFAIKLEYV